MISLSNIMRALADPTRLRIVFLVRRLELSVGELVQILDQSQPRVSRHIRILDEAGLLERRKEGSWVFLRPSGMLTDGSLASLLAEADVSQAKAFQRDLLRLDEVRNARTDMAAQYFAAHADEWDSLRSLHIADSEVEARLAQVLHSAPLGRVLDVGTGTGRIVELFAADSRRLVAIDSSPEMLRLARAKIANLSPEIASKIDIKLGDFNNLPVGAGEFDTAIFHQVLHYAQHPEAVIAEAIRTLAPGGRLVIVDFAAHDLEELRTVHAHARLGFSDDFMKKAFISHGLQMVHQTALEAGALVVKVWMGEKLPTQQPRPTDNLNPKNNLRIVA
ncbi:metalloregulator ArsR/SmtB family transcription factor [Sphingorhabdus sp. EL138]|uniref:ArsR/SmtB family transcription factor n=1 Tax=Sphingorhabdus sp. EL138 TaxID=2073156 RepID=UPI0025DEA26A|nr:metalloregulator ArsR/SmtB family transcription factor [Sphingorhabdus sp. EL138]